jgi:lysophospholipase L1-like esterase
MRARLGPRLLLAIGSLLVVPLTLEVSTRLFLEPIPQNIHATLHPGETEDEQLLWKNLPGYSERDENGPINSHGFRGEEVRMERAPGLFRVLSLGESSAFGDGVLAHETYASVLESTLRARGITGAQVLNAGVRAWSTYQVLLYLTAEIDEIKPDLVLIYNEVNDFLPTTARALSVLGAGLSDRQAVALYADRSWARRLARSSRLITSIQLGWMRSQASRGQRESADRSGTDILSVFDHPYKHIPRQSQLDRLAWMSNANTLVRVPDSDREEALRALVDVVTKSGSALVFMHPAYRFSRPHRYLLTRIAEESDVAVFEVHETMQRLAATQRKRISDFYLDPFHMNVEAHGFVAKELAAFLAEETLLHLSVGESN